MARIKMHIPKAKLPFYPPYEVKCRLQNGVSTMKNGQEGDKTDQTPPITKHKKENNKKMKKNGRNDQEVREAE